MAEAPAGAKHKPLKFIDVYSVSAAGVFSAGVFVLPALGYYYAGPAVFLAYPLAALLVLPSMMSLAELSTALPRSGGPYYFVDRALGPLLGTIAGFGTWLGLVLKAGFAFYGVAAYAWVLTGEEANVWAFRGIAVALAVLFGTVNLLGAKETTKLQNGLVAFLLAALAFFLVQGFAVILGDETARTAGAERYSPFFDEEKGFEGVFAAVGVVFLTFAGLIKTASISEEVSKPDRNLPRVMFAVLISTTLVNMIAAVALVALVDAETLRNTVTPVAAAAEALGGGWLPGSWLLILVALAGVAAFAGSGNGGILGGSKYPYAMARDRLIGERFAVKSRFGSPGAAIIVSVAVMIFFVVVFNIAVVAKLASAFFLLVFVLINASVVVMREARIDSYDPGYRSPLYPWTQIIGSLFCLALLIEMGWLAQAFCAGVVLVGGVWYFKYARSRVERDGAIYHLFERLGRRRFEKLEYEFRGILQEKGARDEDPFDDAVAEAVIIDAPDRAGFEDITRLASEAFARTLPMTAGEVEAKFVESGRYGGAPIAKGAVLPHFRIDGVDRSRLVVARSRAGFPVEIPGARSEEGEARVVTAHAVFFLVSPEADPGLHLRILAQLAGKLDDDEFLSNWLSAPDEAGLKEILLRHERFTAIVVEPDGPTAALVGTPMRDVDWPEGALVAMVRRNDRVFVPRGHTVLQAFDRLTVIGEPDAVRDVLGTFGGD